MTRKEIRNAIKGLDYNTAVKIDKYYLKLYKLRYRVLDENYVVISKNFKNLRNAIDFLYRKINGLEKYNVNPNEYYD